jgi:hypothetical protein
MGKTTWRFQIDNDFGINFKCHMWHGEIENKDFSSIIDYAQKHIISKNLHLADRTKESSHWDKYNLFVELKDDPTVQNIQKSIKQSYKDFIKSIEGEEREVYLNGWLNIMTKGMNLLRHCHANHENSYLSGNLCLTDVKTSRTAFALPDWYDPTRFHIHHEKNKKGHFNLFPQWMHHWVDPIDEDLRIVLGFDLHLKEAYDYYWQNETDTDWPIKRSVKL